jgi:FKBP-type peptidyl-prolyl cis-trans isomerase FklB
MLFSCFLLLLIPEKKRKKDMRLLTAAILILVMVSGFAQNPASESDEIELYSPLDSINYYFGISLGHSIRGASFKIDPALVAVGLYQALEGTTPVSLEESQEIVMEINQRLINQKLDSAYSIPDENLQMGKAFLAENKKREEVHTTPSGLQYEILIEGTGPTPGPTDSVEVHYEGMFIDGEIFDSSYERGKPTIFPLPNVIEGWREGLQLMPVGSTFKLYVPAQLAYGARRTGPIPPYSALIFRITLLGIH